MERKPKAPPHCVSFWVSTLISKVSNNSRACVPSNPIPFSGGSRPPDLLRLPAAWRSSSSSTNWPLSEPACSFSAPSWSSFSPNTSPSTLSPRLSLKLYNEEKSSDGRHKRDDVQRFNRRSDPGELWLRLFPGGSSCPRHPSGLASHWLFQFSGSGPHPFLPKSFLGLQPPYHRNGPTPCRNSQNVRSMFRPPRTQRSVAASSHRICPGPSAPFQGRDDHRFFELVSPPAHLVLLSRLGRRPTGVGL